MEDILITDIQEFEKITDSEVIEKEVPEVLEDIKEGKEIEGIEREPIDKSNDIILGSNAINDIRSVKDVDLSNFDVVDLWVNPNPKNSIGNNVVVNLSDLISNYDFIACEFIYNSSYSNEKFISIIDPSQTYGSKRTLPEVSLTCGSWNNSAFMIRNIYFHTDNTATIGNVTAGTNYNNHSIPVKIIGLKYKEVSEPSEPSNPSIPSVSGNIVNNYYITVSGNGVSYNLINKPLNEYTPTESMFAMSILFALGVTFAILCRKAVFRWK